MRVIPYMLGVCLLIYALQLTAAALAVVLAIAVAIGLITRPREMLGLVVLSALWALLEHYPVQTLGGIAAIWALSWIEVAIRKSTARARTEPANKGERRDPSEQLLLPRE